MTDAQNKSKIGTVKRKIMWTGIGFLLFVIVIICCLYFGEKQIQHIIKKQICSKVIKYEDELLEIVKKCPVEESLYYYDIVETQDNEYFKTIYYKDLKDENVNKVFRVFRLMSIDRKKDNSVEFTVNSTVIDGLLWDNYRYGFYYTENDEPVDVVWGSKVTETEFETTIVGVWTYWYRTEKITDNFWYYETKIEMYYSGMVLFNKMLVVPNILRKLLF